MFRRPGRSSSTAPATSTPVTISSEHWRGTVGLCDVAKEDVEILRELDFGEVAGEVADAFYGRVLQEPHLKAIIDQHSTIDRLSVTLAAYVASLSGGVYDDDLVNGREYIGVVHDRIDLPLAAYLGAFLAIDDVLVERIVNRYAGDPKMLHRALMAYRRVTQADIAIVTQSYIDRRSRALHDLVDQARESSSQLAAASEQSQASVETMKLSSDELTSAAAQAKDAVTKSEQMTVDGEQAARETAAQAAGTRDAVDKAHHDLEDLREQTEQIGAVVARVEAIAEQTNMLSLNAALEAARAGEHGKGFSVVADEVRRLASDTTAALHDITDLNTRAQGAISSVQRSMAQTQEGVSATDSYAAEMLAGFEQIHASQEQVSDHLRLITSRVQELSAGVDEVSRASEHVTGAARDLADITHTTTM